MSSFSSHRFLRVVTLRSGSGLYGGPADTALAQARLVAARGHTVEVFSGIFLGDAPGSIDAPGVHSIEAPVRRLAGHSGFASLLSMRAVADLWKAIPRADVVHISMAREALPVAAAAICLIRRTPYIVQPHGMLTSRSSWLHRLLDVLIRPLYLRSARAIALTDVEADQLAAWSGREHAVSVIGNPVVADLNAETSGEWATDAVFIARLHARKRPEDFVLAAEHAAERNWTDEYLLVGPIQMDACKLLSSVEDAPNLRYRGAIAPADVPQQLMNAKVFVLPSSNEPWGNVLLMSLALGVPAVVSRSAALAHTIEAAGAGMVVPDGDHAAIAQAVHTLVCDPVRHEAASAAARRLFLSSFSDEHVAKALAEAYAAAMSPLSGSKQAAGKIQ